MEIPAAYSAAMDLSRPPEQRIGTKIRIRLDGVLILRVVSYDIERGEIVRTVVDRRGHPLRDPRKPDEWLFQTLRGAVAVEWIGAAYG